MKKKALTAIKGKKGQQLNQREANAIAEGAIDGLLLFDVENRGYAVSLNYNVDGLIPLADFLRMSGMSKRLFVVLLRNIALVLKNMEEIRFSKDLLIWSLYSCYVDPASWRVYMMYVPLQPFEAAGTLRSFLLELVAACNFQLDEDITYVQELVHDVNSVTAYTTRMLEVYCDKASAQLLQQKMAEQSPVRCSVCGSKLNPDEAVCPFCGKQRMVCVSAGGNRDEEQTDFSFPPSGMESRQTQPQRAVPAGKIQIHEDENGVVTVFRGSQHRVLAVWLEDLANPGKIYVSKFPFRIGKMEGVTDYRIQNSAVSRKHADIIKEQGQYFVMDLGSTNGTYLGGRRIQTGVKELLSDGAIVRFANAEYKVHID